MQALVLVGHGSHYDPRSAEPVLAHADRIRTQGPFDEVRAAFWKEEPSLAEALCGLASEAVFVVPVMTSEGYFTEAVFPRELGLAEAREGGDRTVHYTAPIGTHPAMADVIVSSAEAVTGDPDLGPGVGLAVVGHGTEGHAGSAASTLDHAARIRERGRFKEVHACFLDQDPSVGDLTEHLGTEDVVVVPFFVADGAHTTEDIPAALGLPGAEDAPRHVDGRRIWYAGAVGSDPTLVDVIVERAAEAGAERHTDHRSGGDRLGDAGRAFLEWFRGTGTGPDADRAGSVPPGKSLTWGELLLRPTGGGGARYEVRHRADRGEAEGTLDTLADPRALRDLVRFDDHGRFRPLSGARTLPTGWRLADLDGMGLVRAIEVVYPSSVANWHRERAGELDVSHFHETAARQTGIYDVVSDIPVGELANTVERTCAGCVRRRDWEAREGTPIPASPGRGTIPCREACSVLLEAARGAVADDGPGHPAGPVTPNHSRS